MAGIKKPNKNVAPTAQTEVLPGRQEDMAANNAGGFSFKISPWDHLDRFLVLGSEGGTYYAKEQKLTQENAQNVAKLLREDGVRVVQHVVEISDSGRAPKNDPALFVLAMASADSKESVRRAALDALPKVARIGTHLFHYVAFVEGFRGWGRALRKAVANWYLDQPLDRLANQAIKYQNRDGWSHRDLLRLSHAHSTDPQRDAILRWITGGLPAVTGSDYVRGKEDRVVIHRDNHLGFLDAQIVAFEEAKTASEQRVIELIQQANLPREAIPTQHLNSAAVWEALLDRMPMTAMIRNLATMTRSGLLASGSAAEQLIVSRLGDQEVLRRARVHPIQVLSAQLTYAAGRGVRGSNTWTPVNAVVDALDAAFYASFHNVQPTGKNTLLALDVSGSMTMGEIAGVSGLTPRTASAAMALVTMAVEPNWEIIGFTTDGFKGNGNTGYWGSSVKQLNIKPGQSLQTVCKYMDRLGFSGTDCSLPITYALAQNSGAEAFAVYTDNETYAGTMHPNKALEQYRNKTSIPAKLAVVGMTSTGFTIADPKDSGMMDFVGFDAAAPQIMSEFFSR